MYGRLHLAWRLEAGMYATGRGGAIGSGIGLRGGWPATGGAAGGGGGGGATSRSASATCVGYSWLTYRCTRSRMPETNRADWTLSRAATVAARTWLRARSDARR